MTDILEGETRKCSACGQEGTGNYCLRDGSPLLPSQADPLIGEVLREKYRIIDVLGTGGMGAVYKAEHLDLETIVAVKVINSQLSSQDSETFQRFQREGKIINSLIHPNIVRALDFGIYNGNPYLVMDYIRGESLAERLCKVHRLAPRKAISLFVQICDALSYAHNSGVLHRDLKPANIMLVTMQGGQDTVRLLDFGLAKLVNQNENIQRLTETGSFLGTPEYMSPEQCLGRIQELDARTDIYSLGCIMYEALTGQPPITGSNVLETLHSQIKDTAKSFEELGIKGVAPELEAVIFKAIEKSPQDRQSSMMELRRELEKALRPSFSDVGTAPLPVPKRGGLPTLTTGWLAAALFIVLLCGVAVGMFLQRSKPQAAAVRPVSDTDAALKAVSSQLSNATGNQKAPPSHAGITPATAARPGGALAVKPSEAPSLGSAGESSPPVTTEPKIQNPVPAPLSGQPARRQAETARPADVAHQKIALLSPKGKIPHVVPPASVVSITAEQANRIREMEEQAQSFYAGKDRAAGDELIERAILARKEAGPSPAIVDDILLLCESSFKKRDDNAMLKYCDEADQLLRVAHVPSNGQRHADIQSYRAWAYAQQKRDSEAESIFRKALEIHKQAGEEKNAWVTSDLKGLRQALMAQKKFEDVIAVGYQSLNFVTPGTVDEAWAHFAIGEASRQLKDFSKADGELHAATDLFYKNHRWTEYAHSLNQMAASQRDQQKYAAAAKLFDKASDWFDRLHNKESSQNAARAAANCRNQMKKPRHN